MALEKQIFFKLTFTTGHETCNPETSFALIVLRDKDVIRIKTFFIAHRNFKVLTTQTSEAVFPRCFVEKVFYKFSKIYRKTPLLECLF